MSHTTPSEADVTNAISSLKISTAPASQSTKSALKPKNKKVADSWDEDSDGSATETESSPSVLSPVTSLSSTSGLRAIDSNTATPPGPPPPTPASPTGTPFAFPEIVNGAPYAYPAEVGGARERGGSGSGSGPGNGNANPARRPEKTTAVAGRLIAAGLGVRAPRRTEEEREYDRVMREKERKRRDEERERNGREEAERERRKQAVWDD